MSDALIEVQIAKAVAQGRTVTFTPHPLIEGEIKVVAWKKMDDEQIMGIEDVFKPDVLHLQLEAMNAELDRGEREYAWKASVSNSNGPEVDFGEGIDDWVDASMVHEMLERQISPSTGKQRVRDVTPDRQSAVSAWRESL